MGLPSGLLWSPVDLDYTKPGNIADTPFTYMKSFFSWGNVNGHNPLQDRAHFAYDWGGVNSQAPWYDGQIYGSTPGASLAGDIPLSMDAANALLGLPWRMPSTTDFQELFNNCDFVMADGETVIPAGQVNKLVRVDNVTGIYIRSRITGNLLFFACSGYGDNTTLLNRGTHGYYWTLSFYTDANARSLFFRSSGFYPQSGNPRSNGLAIRPVYDPSLL